MSCAGSAAGRTTSAASRRSRARVRMRAPLRHSGQRLQAERFRRCDCARRTSHAMRNGMRQLPWKALVTELKDRGYQSPYLDRLRSRLDVGQAQATLELEIVQEIAAALGRTAAK